MYSVQEAPMHQQGNDLACHATQLAADVGKDALLLEMQAPCQMSESFLKFSGTLSSTRSLAAPLPPRYLEVCRISRAPVHHSKQLGHLVQCPCQPLQALALNCHQ